MREKIARFMQGRCGADQLNRFLSVISIIVMIAGIILNGTTASKNLLKRSAENNRYLRLRMSVAGKFEMIKVRWNQRKEYKFFTCPSCHTTLRVPRHKGRINIVCKKCGTSFRGKT